MNTPSIILAAILAAGYVAVRADVPASYRCGGVGVDESEKMKAEAGSHDMMLTFASSTGAYVADVQVDIRDAKGQAVVSAKCGGPIMLVDLPAAGDYSVNAQFNGVSRQQTMRVGKPGKGARATFTWPAN